MRIYYLLITPETDVGRAELNAGHHTIKKLGKWPVKVVRPERLNEVSFEPGDIIWCHAPCSDLPAVLQTEPVKKILLDAVESGVNLFLTLTACLLASELGIESRRPDLCESSRWRKETGLYAYRGMAAFDEHPLFNQPNSLHTTFLSWTPQTGEPFWTCLYSTDGPENVIAKGVRYLTAIDDQACCWEYRVGKGKILCVGAYLYFNARRNYRRPYSEAFLENCVEYLSVHDSKQPDIKFYWPTRNTGIKEANLAKDPDIPEFNSTLEHEKYFVRNGVPFLKANRGNNFFSCAGRRILAMGHEGEQLDEIWAYPSRLLNNYYWSVRPDGKGDIPQKGMPSKGIIYPDAIQQTYEYGAYGVREQIGTNIFKPIVYMNYEIVAERDFTFQLSMKSDLAQMWPMPRDATGKILYQYDEQSRTILLKSSEKLSWCKFILSKEVSNISFKDNSNDTASEIEITVEFPLMKPGMHYLTFAIIGGGEVTEVPNYDSSLDLHSTMDIARSGDHYRKMMRSIFKAITPEKDINDGTRWAQLKMEAFRAITPTIGRGLTAGLASSGEDWMATRPGYGWYFGRDSMWTSLALLTVNQWNTVNDSLMMLAEHQAIDGKLFHELSPSNYVHYDSADANLLFIIVAERYLAWTGDDQLIERLKPILKKALDFSFNADRDGDCLTENTGVGHGWVEGGKLAGAHVTFYLAGLWLRALESAAILFKKDKDKLLRQKIEFTAVKVKELLRTQFVNEEKQTYFYAINTNREMMQADTIMPAAVILFGDTDRDIDLKFLKRASGPDIVTDWGARMISELDERYSPAGYHIGSVWPLFTGWLGLAQYQREREIQGFELLQGGMAIYRDFSSGCFSEVIRGDTYTEAGICPQQAWSAGLMLLLLTKGMLGMEMLTGGTLLLSPIIPAHWPRATFKNIKWCDGAIDLRYRRFGNRINFTIFNLKPGDQLEFKPQLPNGSEVEGISVSGNSVPFESKVDNRNPRLEFEISPDGKTIEIEIILKRFISPVPDLMPLEPNRQSLGFRIIDWQLKEDMLEVEISGYSGARYELKIVDPLELLDSKAKRKGEQLHLPFSLPKSESKYSKTLISIPIRNS